MRTLEEEIKITGQITGKIKEEEEIRFRKLLKQIEAARGLKSFNEQIGAILDEVDKSHLANEMSYGSQLQELNQLTTRISEVFVGLAKQNETNVTFMKRQHQEEIEKREEALKESKLEIEHLRLAVSEKKKLFEETLEKLKKLEESLPVLNERIEDQKRIIATQENQLKSLNETVAHQVQQIEGMIRDISQNKELKETIETLHEEMKHLQEKHERDIQQREFSFKQELFEKEKELQQSSQEKIEKIQDNMNDKYEERLAGITEKHDNRVNTLLREVSSLEMQVKEREQRETGFQERLKELEAENQKLKEQLKLKK